MANYLLEALKRQKLQQMSHQPQPLPPDLLGALADAEGTLYDKSMIYKALKDAVTAPGRAYRGEIDALGDPFGSMEEAMNTAGMAQLGGIPGGARGPGSVGMITYHGSPHKFDKFDMSKIGTGEGAQAYGHGLYMAESPETARTYKIMHTDIPDRSFKLKYNIQSAQARGDSEKVNELLSELESLKKNEPGNLYKVDIPDEAVARMLDWDKPLSMQSPEVRKAFGKLVGRDINHETGWAKLTGEEALKAAQERAGWAGKGSGESLLRQQGIPGIRYLDGGSRTAGDGTSNFVLFDDQLPRILERNGEATGMQPWQPGEANALLGIPSRPRNALGQKLSPSKVRQLIDMNSSGEALDFDKLRSAIGQSPYELTKVKLASILPDDLAVDASRAMPEKGPIVVGPDGRIIDGRHRAAFAKSQGLDEIEAYMPMVQNTGRPRNALNQEIPPTQYELAHAEAQRVAALPVEQGGLGLPEGNTAMERARTMGFEDAYHGRSAFFEEDFDPINNFDMQKLGSAEGGKNSDAGFWFTSSPREANTYAKETGEVMPVMLRNKDFTRHNFTNDMRNELTKESDYLGISAEDIGKMSHDDMERIYSPDGDGMWSWMGDKIYNAKSSGAPGTVFENVNDAAYRGIGGLNNQSVVYDPSRIRSRFAAFNPSRRDSADLLASFGVPVASTALLSYLLGGSNDAEAGNLYDYLSQE